MYRIVFTLVFAAALMACACPLCAEWLDNGTPLCTETGIQKTPLIVSDNAGGAIVGWMDYRNENWDVYAQRIDPEGNKMWGASDVEVCAEVRTQFALSMATDGAGGAVLCWIDKRVAWDVYAQRVDAAGRCRWDLDGNPVCTAIDEQNRVRMVSDDAGGVVCMWLDRRHGWEGGHRLYAQKMNESGVPQWPIDGVAVCAACKAWVPDLVRDGGGGVIVTWGDARVATPDIYAQRIDSKGIARWSAEGQPVRRSPTPHIGPFTVPDGAGGAIVAWWDKDENNRAVYVQLIDQYGDKRWPGDGVAVSAQGGNQNFGRPAPDGTGGAFVTWHDDRGDGFDIYAQRISASGELLWPEAGVAVCAADGNQKHPVTVPDGFGGVVIAWSDVRSGDTDNYDIYLQRIDATGTIHWSADGVAACNAPGDQAFPEVCTDGAGGVFVVWDDFRNGDDTDIFVTRINGDGGTGRPSR